ncbi:MAG: hypothetical protein IJ636_08650 [Bacteroidales bacterium]|nr:hypothetical protein [Bacteroidales bacterium]
MTKILILMSLLSLLGCGHNAPAGPAARLERIYYSATHGYHAYSNIGYSAERLADGKTRIVVEVGNDRDRIFEADGSVMDSLEAIVREYRMDRYDGHYRPKMDILDGDSWSLSLTFSDGKESSCSGYMAYPPKGGAAAIGKVEDILSRWLYIEPAEEVALTRFRYEFHDAEGDEVYYFNRSDSFNAVYFRPYGSREGWNYYCGDTTVLVWMAREIQWSHLGSYTGEDLSQEDKSRPRWLVIAEYEDGTKYEKIDYLDRQVEDRWRQNVPSFTEMGFRSEVQQRFSEEIHRIEALEPTEKGKHSCTTYDKQGKALRTINYDGAGDVLNGHDYRDPDLKF